MRVVLLAGGAGSRLMEETVVKPKPMVEIGRRPILWHIMKIYGHYGFSDFVICLGYKGEVIKDYFYHYETLNNDFTIKLGAHQYVETHGSHGEEGWRVTLCDTGEKALKGSRIKQVEKYIDSDPFMLTYGDGVANVDLHALLAFHKDHGKIATLTGVRPPSRFGELKTRKAHVVQFSEKPQASGGLINGGFFVFRRKFLDYLTADEGCDLETGALQQLAGDGQLMVYEHTGEWECMDTLRDVHHLNRIWRENRAFWKVWT